MLKEKLPKRGKQEPYQQKNSFRVVASGVSQNKRYRFNTLRNQMLNGTFRQQFIFKRSILKHLR